MLILYAALKYDYGHPEQGYSYEHYNFYDSLVRMGNDILYLDVGSLTSDSERSAVNRLLLETVRAERPDVLFVVLFTDELDKRVVREISLDTDTTTIGWFSDDHWRFDTYSREWASHFDWAVTTSTGALTKYRALGYDNVIKSQWACNTAIYAPLDVPKRLPVSFVGLPHGDRRYVIQALRDAGIEVHTFGKGWATGRITQDEMVRIFNESYINLNLGNASASRTLAGRSLALVARALARAPLAPKARAVCMRGVVTLDRFILGSRLPTYAEQIKGRNFEVPGCGGFLLTSYAENLEDYYVPEREVACYRDVADLIAQVRKYLANSEDREAIARAGHERTLREHTWVHRFGEIFSRIGMSSLPADAVLSGAVAPGQTLNLR